MRKPASFYSEFSGEKAQCPELEEAANERRPSVLDKEPAGVYTKNVREGLCLYKLGAVMCVGTTNSGAQIKREEVRPM